MTTATDLAAGASTPIHDAAFTPAVTAFQARRGSAAAYEKLRTAASWKARGALDARSGGFVLRADSAYLATASADGRPYVQHRGGPRGFLKVLDARTIAWAEYPGNRQYVSAGNLTENDQAQLFLMDYAQRERLKVWGRARIVEGDEELLARVTDPAYGAPPEHVVVFTVEAWDFNCPQHIEQRFTREQLAPEFDALRARIAELEARLEQASSA